MSVDGYTGHLNGNKISSRKYKEIFDRVGPENMYIELIESYPCNNIEELKKREQEVTRNHKMNKQQTDQDKAEPNSELPLKRPTITTRPLNINVLNQINDMFANANIQNER